MFCVKCGNQLSDGDLFCAKCGAAVKGTSEQAAPSPIAGNQPAVRDCTPTEETCGNDIRKMTDEELITSVRRIRRIAMGASWILLLVMIYLFYNDLSKAMRSTAKKWEFFDLWMAFLLFVGYSGVSFDRIFARAVRLRHDPGYIWADAVMGFSFGMFIIDKVGRPLFGWHSVFSVLTIVLTLFLGVVCSILTRIPFIGSRYRELRRRRGLISKEDEIEDELTEFKILRKRMGRARG